MKNVTNFEESGRMPQEQGIDNQPPPPYTVENTSTIYNVHNATVRAVQTVYSNYLPNIPNLVNRSSLDLFIQTLGNNDRFTFHATGRLNCANKMIIVHIRDARQRPILSVMTIPGRNISTSTNNDNSIRIGSVIQMTNASGQTLLTGSESGQSIAVSSGEQVLGIIEGNLLFSSNLTVQSTMGEHLFHSAVGMPDMTNSSEGCCSPNPSEFNLIANGVPIAHVGRSTNTTDIEITFFNSHNLDSRTKALLLFTGYLVYYMFMAETSFGNIGARGLGKRICFYTCIFFVIIVILLITIPIVFINT